MALFTKNKPNKFLKSAAKQFSCSLPELETNRLFLRKITAEHVDDMYEYSKNPNVIKYLTWYEHVSKKQTENYVKHLQKQYQNGSFFDWALIDKQNLKMIGTCGFTSFDFEHNSAEIGYVLSEYYWGMGLACEAALEVMRFAFDVMKVSSVHAKFIDGNNSSARVMQKCGMSFDAIYYNSMFIKGEYKTIQVYSINREDFYKNTGVFAQ